MILRAQKVPIENGCGLSISRCDSLESRSHAFLQGRGYLVRDICIHLEMDHVPK